MKNREASAISQRDFMALLLHHFGVADHGRESFALCAEKPRGEIPREQRIILCAGDSLLSVVLGINRGLSDGDQGSGKLHLWIVAPALKGELNQRVAIKSLRRIVLLTEPLLVGFRRIARVKNRKWIGLLSGRGGFCGVGARHQAIDEFLRGDAIFFGVERGAAQCFHVYKRDLARVENRDCVCSELCCVVFFATAEIPIVADPRQGVSTINIERMADEGWAGECRRYQERKRKNCDKKKTSYCRCRELHLRTSCKRICIRFERRYAAGKC